MADNKFGFGRVLRNVEALKKTLPVVLANQAQNFFVDSFKKAGWDDGTVTKWPARSIENKKNKGRALLVKSGKLRRAVGNSIRLKTFDKVLLTVPLPYAAVHNDGYNGIVKSYTRARFTKSTTSEFIGLRKNKDGKLKQNVRRTSIYIQTGEVSVKAHNMNMPQRKFIGDSATLRKMQVTEINKAITKVWQA